MHDKDPIANIVWKDARSLTANNWNPNVVFTPELRLLEHSLLSQGWIQPILINNDNMIIDGFHRWRLSLDSEAVAKRYNHMVPCCVLPLSKPEAMLLTIRINRAKGSHMATQMSAIVRELIDVHGYDAQMLSVAIGATLDEINLLHNQDVFEKKKIKDYAYSKAWYPAEKNG